MTQGRTASCQEYLECFQNCVDVVEHCGGTVGVHQSMVSDILTESNITTPSTDKLAAATATAKDKYLSYVFIYASDRVRYGRMIEDLENQYTQGNDNYPKTMNAVFKLLVYWKCSSPQPIGTPARGGDSMAFATTKEEREKENVEKKVEPPLHKIQCYRCREMGHYATSCTKELDGVTGKTMLMAGF